MTFIIKDCYNKSEQNPTRIFSLRRLKHGSLQVYFIDFFLSVAKNFCIDTIFNAANTELEVHFIVRIVCIF